MYLNLRTLNLFIQILIIEIKQKYLNILCIITRKLFAVEYFRNSQDNLTNANFHTNSKTNRKKPRNNKINPPEAHSPTYSISASTSNILNGPINHAETSK